MSPGETPITSWQAAPEQALERQMLEEARRYEPASWLPAERAEVLGSIREDLARAHGRGQIGALAIACCAVAFLAGLWAASRVRGAGDATAAAPPVAATSAAYAPQAASLPARVAPELAAPPRSAPGEQLMRWETLEFAGVGLIEVSGAGEYRVRELEAERQLRIESGVLRAQIARQDPLRPLVIAAPDLRVVVVGTRFDVFVEGALTRVEVIEGHVRVESGARSVAVSGGESVRSDDPRLQPPPVAAPGPVPGSVPHAAATPKTLTTTMMMEAARAPVAAACRESLEDCDRFDLPRLRSECLRRVADGGDTLVAQEALLALGMIARDVERDPDRAIDYWRQYGARFPSGALGPEVALNLFETLLLRGRTEEALATAASFEERFPNDPRASRVALARARILCGVAGERVRGRAILDRLSANLASPRALKADVDELRVRCAGPSFGPAGPNGLVPRDVLGGAPPGD